MAQRLGHARLAIPRVNPNPRPPRIGQRQRVGPRPRAALANRVAVGKVHGPVPTADPSSNIPPTQTTPTDPLQNAQAPAPPKPTGLFDLPAYAPQAGQADPRDATYWSNLAKLKFTDEQEYNKGLLEQQRADTSYSDALQTAIRQRGIQERELGEGAIRGNLGASGWLSRNEAEQTTAYTEDRSHAARQKEEEDQSRKAAQAALLASFGIDASNLLSEAGERYAEKLLAAAENEEPLVGLEEPAAAGGTGGKGKGKGKGKGPKVGIGPARPLRPAKQAIGNRRKAR